MLTLESWICGSNEKDARLDFDKKRKVTGIMNFEDWNLWVEGEVWWKEGVCM